MVSRPWARARCSRACVMVDGRALLVAITPESGAALGAPEREITRFPYRVGRESRGMHRTAYGIISERSDPVSRPSNDLYLV